ELHLPPAVLLRRERPFASFRDETLERRDLGRKAGPFLLAISRRCLPALDVLLEALQVRFELAATVGRGFGQRFLLLGHRLPEAHIGEERPGQRVADRRTLLGASQSDCALRESEPARFAPEA